MSADNENLPEITTQVQLALATNPNFRELWLKTQQIKTIHSFHLHFEPSTKTYEIFIQYFINEDIHSVFLIQLPANEHFVPDWPLSNCLCGTLPDWQTPSQLITYDKTQFENITNLPEITDFLSDSVYSAFIAATKIADGGHMFSQPLRFQVSKPDDNSQLYLEDTGQTATILGSPLLLITNNLLVIYANEHPHVDMFQFAFDGLPYLKKHRGWFLYSGTIDINHDLPTITRAIGGPTQHFMAGTFVTSNEKETHSATIGGSLGVTGTAPSASLSFQYSAQVEQWWSKVHRVALFSNRPDFDNCRFTLQMTKSANPTKPMTIDDPQTCFKKKLKGYIPREADTQFFSGINVPWHARWECDFNLIIPENIYEFKVATLMRIAKLNGSSGATSPSDRVTTETLSKSWTCRMTGEQILKNRSEGSNLSVPPLYQSPSPSENSEKD